MAIPNSNIRVHQGSAGLLCKANHEATCALIAAAKCKSSTVFSEHIRLAATEIV